MGGKCYYTIGSLEHGFQSGFIRRYLVNQLYLETGAT